MKANVGTVDKVVRLVAGAAAIAFGFMGGLEAPWNFVAMGVGAVFVVTALMNFCPAYAIFGMNSCPRKPAE